MSTTSQAIQITPTDTNLDAFTLSSDDIISVNLYGSTDSTVKYANNNRKVTKINVDETPTVISNASLTMFAVTLLSNSATIYLNATRVQAIYDNGSGAIIVYDSEGPAWEEFYVTESQTDVQTLVNAIADIVPIPLAQHITATTQSTSIATGALVVDGGVGIAKDVYVGGVLNGEVGVNLATLSGVTTIGSATPVTVSAAGVVTVASTTDSTTKDTGSVILQGGMGVEKAIVTGTSIASGTTLTAGTALAIGTDVTLAKEVNHTVTVTTSTTATAVGGSLDVVSGAGATSGAGGAASVKSGAGGVTGAGGVLTVASGAGGATSGASGAVNIASGAATIGSSGTVTIASGNTASGVAGDIALTPGTFTSTTVSPMISLNKAVVRKPRSTAFASGDTALGIDLVGGLLAATGATGNFQLPDTADITTAIGSTPAGTYFEFIFNAAAMTATNTATLVVGANMSVQSSPAITGGGTLTVTQDTQVIGKFGVFFDTATTCKIVRLA